MGRKNTFSHRIFIMSGTVAVSERMGSPNKVRIGHLSEKLVSLQDELEHEKQARSDAVELKLKVLDDKLLRAQIAEDEQLKPLNEQISRYVEELSAELSPVSRWTSARPKKLSRWKA